MRQISRRSSEGAGLRETDIFAEVEPVQKERIILAPKKAGTSWGTWETASTMSLHSMARMLASRWRRPWTGQRGCGYRPVGKRSGSAGAGVQEGRHTFANTVKYVYMAMSANFGNMFSMAGASLILSFLPLLPTQILLTNLITDFPEMAIASDRVDPDMVAGTPAVGYQIYPQLYGRFWFCSVLFSTSMTFGVLLLVLKASPELFSHRLVSGICGLRLSHRPGHSQPPPLFTE